MLGGETAVQYAVVEVAPRVGFSLGLSHCTRFEHEYEQE